MSSEEATQPSHVDLPEVDRVPAFGSATPAVVTVGVLAVSVVSWWLLADPDWSLTGASAPVVSCLLFWTILGFIVTGFTFANWPFSTLAQPLAGCLHVISNLVFGIVMTLLFTRGLGSWDPTFAADAPGGVGYTAAAFIVLIGFYAYTLAAANWGGYPFESVPAPLASVAQFFLAAFITLIGVVVLVYPNFNVQLAADAPISLPTALGWVYSSIVVAIASAMQWGNAPWAWIGNRHLRALGAAAVTLGGGYLLMRVLEVVVKQLDPGSVTGAPTYSATAQTAQIGVCISLCSLLVGLVVAPVTPDTGTRGSVVRTLAVLVAAAVTYVLFTRVLATTVLHFPAVDGRYGGDALAFIDWVILIVLWHAVAFGGHLATRRSPSPVAGSRAVRQ